MACTLCSPSIFASQSLCVYQLHFHHPHDQPSAQEKKHINKVIIPVLVEKGT